MKIKWQLKLTRSTEDINSRRTDRQTFDKHADSHYSNICVFVQLKELEEEWGKLPGTPAAPTRLLRSQQQQDTFVTPPSSSSESAGGAVGGAAAPVAPQVIDPYDLADPEDFLGKMPKDFFDKIVRKT